MKKIPIINQIIKDKRKELKITQEEFKNIINKGIATIKRYDTGDIIPENTLILICDKLTLSLPNLCLKQQEENKKDNTNFYSELIKKYTELDFIVMYHEIDFFTGKEDDLGKTKTALLIKYGNKLKQIYENLYLPKYHNSMVNQIKGKDLKKIEYICTQEINDPSDYQEYKNIIKEVIELKDGKKEERILNIFNLRESIDFIENLENIFNGNILLINKKKLLQGE